MADCEPFCGAAAGWLGPPHPRSSRRRSRGRWAPERVGSGEEQVVSVVCVAVPERIENVGVRSVSGTELENVGVCGCARGYG